MKVSDSSSVAEMFTASPTFTAKTCGKKISLLFIVNPTIFFYPTLFKTLTQAEAIPKQEIMLSSGQAIGLSCANFCSPETTN